MNNAQAVPLNCGTFVGTNIPTYIFKKPNIGGDFFKLIITPLTRVISSSTSNTINQKDLILVQSSGSTTITDYKTSIQQLIPGSYNISIYSNNSGVILGANSAGLASGISTGSASLIGVSTDGFFSSRDVTVSYAVGTTGIVFSSYANNSLAKHTSDAIDNRIAGKTASIAKSVYTTQNHSTSTYVRNIGCWASDLDLTSISPWNSTENNTRAGTLISRRHILFAAHYQINNGATIRFVDNNNNVITRTMINKLTHPSYTPYYPDITIGVLDSDVPNSISFAKILPTNWANYLPNLSVPYRVPALVLDQEEKALISELSILNTTAGFNSPDTNSARYAFFENLIGGDSGNPAFLIINGELVIITVWTYGSAGVGTSIIYHKDAINTMMASLSPGLGYSLTEVSLSGFNFYS